MKMDVMRHARFILASAAFIALLEIGIKASGKSFVLGGCSMSKAKHCKAVVYIAGKYSAPTKDGVSENIEKARAVYHELLHNGFGAFCPHVHSAHLEDLVPAISYELFLEMDLQLMNACNVIVFLPGWENSPGAVREYEHAQNRGIEIFLWKDINTFLMEYEAYWGI